MRLYHHSICVEIIGVYGSQGERCDRGGQRGCTVLDRGTVAGDLPVG